MQFTNINVDGIEEALPIAFLNIRKKVIEDALKTVNIWLTPDPNKIEVINVLVHNYRIIGMTHPKFPLGISEQRQLLERMFDKNMYAVSVSTITASLTKSLFGTKVENITSENQNFIFSTSPLYLNQELDIIKDMLSALRNPRVILTVEEHKNFTSRLKRFDINLSDYYI